MPETISILVNGHPVVVPKGATVSAALLLAGVPCRLSVEGQPRFAALWHGHML